MDWKKLSGIEQQSTPLYNAMLRCAMHTNVEKQYPKAQRPLNHEAIKHNANTRSKHHTKSCSSPRERKTAEVEHRLAWRTDIVALAVVHQEILTSF